MLNSVLDTVAGFVPLPPPASRTDVKPAPKPAGLRFPVRVGTGVQAAKVLDRVMPVYPPLARQARVSGVVRLEAIIGRDGCITNLRVLSGHPLLAPAALEAVRQWVYSPTLLNGEAVEVITEIQVNFTLAR